MKTTSGTFASQLSLKGNLLMFHRSWKGILWKLCLVVKQTTFSLHRRFIQQRGDVCRQQREQQKSNRYTAISKKVVGETGERRMSNGGCTTERNCAYAI